MKINIYTQVLKTEKQFRYVILANIISRFGDSIDAIAYSWMAYMLTGSKAWLAVILGVNMIPTVIFQPLGGALTEYFDKKKIIVICDFLRGTVVFVTGLFILFGILKPWHLLVLTFINSTIEALRVPNGLAILPAILKKDNYKVAISLNQGISRTAELIGMGCAGLIIGTLGIWGALFIDAITFILSGVLFTLIKAETGKTEDYQLQTDKYLSTLKEGFHYFRNSDLAILVCSICVILNLCTIPIDNLQAAYISEHLRLGVFAMSVGSTAMTTGMIAGSLLLPLITQKISDKKMLLNGGILIGSLYFIYILAGFIPWDTGKYICYFGVAFIFGFVNSVIGVTVQVIFMTRVPSELVGRISSIFNSLACSSVPVGSFILAGVSTFLSITHIYLLAGIFSIVAFLVISRFKGIKEFEIRKETQKSDN